MTPWIKQKLGDVCLQITDGKHGDCQNLTDSGFYFISSKDVFDGFVHYGNARQITEKDFIDTHKRTKLEVGDVLITNSGTIGRMALIKQNDKVEKTTFQKSVAILKPDKDKIDNIFLYYFLLSKYNQLVNLGGGAAQHNLLLGDLRKFEITTPNRSVQQNISSTISLYDDLINNNEKRIKILEEMTQRLYTEWFVKFKFPGHEKVKMANSGTDFGIIPEGWEVKSVENLVKRIPVGKKYEDKTVFNTGKVPVLDQGKTGVIGYHNDNPGVNASIESPVIVFANHTCYQNIIIYPFSAIQNVLPFVPNDDRNIYWLHWATKDLIRFNDYKGHWPEFMSKKLICPCIELTKEFGKIVSEYVVFKYSLERQNINLINTRDLLILRLVIGKRELSNND